MQHARLSELQRIPVPHLEVHCLGGGGEPYEVRESRSEASRFAENVVGPTGAPLDRMAAEANVSRAHREGRRPWRM
jgi:hypothetical protein